MSNQLISLEAFAEIAGICKNTAYRLAKSRAIPSYRIGNQYRIDCDQVLLAMANDDGESGELIAEPTAEPTA